jgi:hypothetical protein
VGRPSEGFVPAEVEDVEQRLDLLRRGLRRLIVVATDDPDHPAIVRQIKLASEVMKADRKSVASAGDRLVAMEAGLEERGLLDRANRNARSIEAERSRRTS